MSEIVRFDRFEFDLRSGRLRKRGRLVRLQPKPSLLLASLLRSQGCVVTREELRAALWPTDTHVEFDTCLNAAARRVRRALGDTAADPRYIRTIPGVGYSFIGAIVRPEPLAVSVVAPPVDAPAPPVHGRSMARAAAVVLLTLGAALAIPTGHGSLTMADSHLRRGRALMAADRPDVPAALAAFEAAVARDARNTSAWGWLALATARLAFSGNDPSDARYAVAAAATERASADPSLWTAHAAHAYVRAGQGRDWRRAADAFETAVSLGADDPRVLVDYTGVLKELRRFDRALAVVDHGLQWRPRSAALLAHRGLLLHALGRYDDELPTLVRAVSVDPHSAEAYFHLGLGYARRRRYPESVAALRAAVSLSNEAPHFLSWLGRLAADGGDRATAEAALQKLRLRAATTPVPADLIDSVAFHLAAARR